MKDYGKIQELVKRIQVYEKDGKPLYLSIYFTNRHNTKDDDPTPYAMRISGEAEFQSKVSEVLSNMHPYKIFVREFPNKSKNTREGQFKRETIIEVKGESEHETVLIQQPPANGGESENSFLKELYGQYGGLSGFEQKIRSDVAKEYQLHSEQEQKKKLIEENVLLKKEKQELEEENNKLYQTNEELAEEVQKLQKYVPENIKIGDVSVTKVLGSILGTAAETIAKNVVTKRPEKVKEILGETAFEQLAGLLEDEPENTDGIDENQIQQPIEELHSTGANPGQEDKHMQVAGAIHQLNQKITSSQLGKIQLVYYFFLNEDESINNEKLDTLIKFINANKPENDE